MKTTPTAHDALFKQFLTHPETARDFLDTNLPPALRQACDLSTMRLESCSFVEDDLRAYYSDMLYSLKARQGDGYIYALIEHQSTPARSSRASEASASLIRKPLFHSVTLSSFRWY